MISDIYKTNNELNYWWIIAGFLSCSIYMFFYLSRDLHNIFLPIMKILVFAIPWILILKLRKSYFHKAKFALLALYTMMLFSFFFGVLYSGGIIKDLFFFNTFFSIGYLLLDVRKIENFLNSLLAGVTLSLLIGGCWDVYAWIGGFSLWDEKSFVGGVGNPSSFGFLCNICICWLLGSKQQREKLGSVISIIIVASLSALSLMSFSMFSLLNLIMILSFFLFTSSFGKAMKIMLSLLIVIASIMVSLDFDISIFTQLISFVLHKLMGVGDFLGLIDYGVTASSVDVRVGIHQRAIHLFENDWLSMILGHPDKIVYDPNDSQYLTYALSFGIPLTLCFIFLNLYFLYLSVIINKKFYIMLFLSFLLIFTTNRILDYFPIAIIYFSAISALTNEYRLKRLFR